MGLDINLEFDAAAQAAPASFRAAIQKAASILDAAFSNAVTINIEIQYGESNIQSGGANGGPSDSISADYSSVRADLIAAAPGDNNFAALPTGSSIQGQSSLLVWRAQEKLLGMLPPDDAGIDGTVDFSTAISQGDLVGVALHELTHALGRLDSGPEPDVFDFFCFTSPGVRLFSETTPSPAAYFSVDGGHTKLADYGETSDPSDYLNPPNSNLSRSDLFNEFYNLNTIQTLTTLDLKQMDVLGYIPVPNHERINGGSGVNVLVGRARATTFAFYAIDSPFSDTITNFKPGTTTRHDVLELHSLPAAYPVVPGSPKYGMAT
jgi:hypothetical protein